MHCFIPANDASRVDGVLSESGVKWPVQFVLPLDPNEVPSELSAPILLLFLLPLLPVVSILQPDLHIQNPPLIGKTSQFDRPNHSRTPGPQLSLTAVHVLRHGPISLKAPSTHTGNAVAHMKGSRSSEQLELKFLSLLRDCFISVLVKRGNSGLGNRVALIRPLHGA